MTVRGTNVPYVSHFVGRSSDDKPTSNVPPGSEFIEINTGRTYTFDGEAWGLTYALPEDVMDINLLVPRSIVDEAVLDEGEADWTSPTDLVAIAPVANSPLREARVFVDLDKATTGFATLAATEELTLTVLRKVDGTNWRVTETKAAVAGDDADGLAVEFDLGTVGDDEQVKVQAALSAEVDGSTVIELPCLLYYLAAEAPTVTAAEAGA